MTAYLIEWLELIFRWLHLLVGVAWIGASLHYVKVDRSLEPDTKDAEIKGRFWAIHGGGIYQFTKYELAPPQWPAVLHWSKWEAYSTWLTGMGLMVLVYYLRADVYLLSDALPGLSSAQAVMLSLGLIAGSVGLYECLIRSPIAKRETLFAGLIALLISALVLIATQWFPGRAAFIHVGVILGSIMVGNVLFGIIPAQKAFVVAVKQGQAPNLPLTLLARQRSFFNNYLTLPVLFCMISLHFSSLYQHRYNFVGLVVLLLAGAVGRHFFNLRHLNINRPRYLVLAVLAIVLVIGLMSPDLKDETVSGDKTTVPDLLASTEIDQLALKHCGNCHSMQPTQPGFIAPPGGLVIADHQGLLKYRARSSTAVGSGYMPLGNLTKMTPVEREQLMNFLWYADLESNR